jgi:futalosine hydrolase
MKVLVVSATEFEIGPFLKENKGIDVVVTGIGITSATYNLTRKLLQNKYDLVIQAGIAGSYNNKFQNTNVVLVGKDTFGDCGIVEKGNFKTLFESGLMQENDFPFKNGWLMNNSNYISFSKLPIAKGITVNRITDDSAVIRKMAEKFDADVESMEGAALHYVCLQQQQSFLQLRGISNAVGERNKEKWATGEAITNLNKELKILIQNLP